MATISLHDLAVQNDGHIMRVNGIYRLGFTSTEVRSDVGFNVGVNASGVQSLFGLTRLLKMYYETDPGEFAQARTRIRWQADDKVNASLAVEEFRPEGQSSADIPFDLAMDLSQWLNYVDAEFGSLPEYAEEIKKRLLVRVTASVSPRIGGAGASCIFPQLDPLLPEPSEPDADE